MVVSVANLTFQSLSNLFQLNNSPKCVLLVEKCVLLVEPKQVSIRLKEDVSVILATAKIKMGVLKLAKKGELGPLSKEIISGELNVMYNKAYEAVIVGTFPNLGIPAYKQVGASQEFVKSEVSTKESVMTSNPVLLRKATEVLQPVRGSNEESIYYAIAIGGPVNVGCRVKSDGGVSVRVEGDIDSVSGSLAVAGFTSASEDHWALHMKIPDPILIKKTVGAVLFALSLPFTKLVGDITPIMGKGI